MTNYYDMLAEKAGVKLTPVYDVIEFEAVSVPQPIEVEEREMTEEESRMFRVLSAQVRV